MKRRISHDAGTYLYRYCFNIVMAVTTWGFRPLDRACS